jgi:hypothetical protein
MEEPTKLERLKNEQSANLTDSTAAEGPSIGIGVRELMSMADSLKSSIS